MSHSIAELKYFQNRAIYYLDTCHHVHFEVLALTLKWLNIFIRSPFRKLLASSVFDLCDIVAF